MPEELETKEGEVTSETKEAELAAKLETLEKKVESSGTLAQLMADPEVRAILEAKQRGEKVKVVLGEEKVPTKVEIEEDIDLDGLSNKDLVKHILKKVSTIFDGTLSSKLTPLTEQIKNLSGYVGTAETQAANKQIEIARGKHADFDTYIPEMRELNKVNGGLSVEELYLIAKSRKAGPDASKVSSEKPTSTSVKAPAKVTRKNPLPPGKAGFDIAMAEALSELEIPDSSGVEE